ncbi:hypothetical protein [Halorubrum sp. Atlit-26R]|uniref:hypothetical protein n=1 Tax=Halorubrum sp. Atlit-26R TaxID=2282128 RepID=UPI000EF1A33E|nr:hypothetical protein [Halorubrum sp. Atlit-26R]RLM62510.1 hypothetical protein DVK07_18780 [Halorubrum sp. Atlit-26R]
MSEETTSSTFGGWADRITWLLAEGQMLALGLMFTLGGILLIYRPSLPTVPPIVVGWLAALMLFGPPLFGFFVAFVRRLRSRRMVEVHEIDARRDTVKKWYVEPEIWSSKSVDGPNPYPVNGGSGWGVQSFEFDEDMGSLRVRGVWLSECEDTALLTKKSHMESIYEKLTESHISLKIMRESISELGADIQGRIISRGAEAREKGTMMDPTGVKEVFESFEKDIEGIGADDLPTLELDESMGMGEEAEPAASEPAEEAPADD